MRRSKRVYLNVMLIAVAAIMVAGSVELDAGSTFANEFISIWKGAKDYSVKVAEAMPEEHYNFKPTPEIMSFGEQVAHSAGAAFWFGSKIAGEENPAKDFKAEGKSKAQIIEHLKKSFDYVEKIVTNLTDEEAAKVIPLFGEVKLTKAQTIMAVRDHTTHHRGSMVIYLRLKGIKPPQYVGW